MTKDKELYVALFQFGANADGEDGYWRVGEDFALSELGGVLPHPGDVIVSSYAHPHKPETHVVYEVESRWFRPVPEPKAGFLNVGLVVKKRKGEKEETHLIVGGG